MHTIATPSEQDDVLVVLSKRREADGLVSIELERPGGGRLPDWTAGAHIDLILENGITRQYSLCGDASDPRRYRIGVLREPDGRGGSRYVHDQLAVGDRVRFGGPRNNFTLVPSAHYSFLAAGVGITPLLPMIQTAQQLGAAWRLLYLGRSRSTMAFLDELHSFTGSGIVEIHPSDELGRADLAAWIGSAPDESKLYVCGPAPVVGAVDGLTATWRHGWVRRERFAAPLQPAPARSAPFHVELRHSGMIVQVPTDVSVADALRRAGAPLLTSCGQGVCGTCETTVIEGTPDHRDSLLDDAERESNACFFPCVSRSISDRLVLDL